MNADNDQEVRDRLGAALSSISPRSAPFDAAVRQGRSIKARRRVSLVAGLAAAAVAVVAVPTWLSQHIGGPARPPAVTVSSPGPGSPPGLVASGTVGGSRWHLIVLKPDGKTQCYLAGSAQGDEVCSEISQHPTEPASFSMVNRSGNGLQVTFGPVRQDVTRVDVRLGDGQLLRLHPVLQYGVRYVAYATVPHQYISSATAYTGDRILASAVPLNLPGLTLFSVWLRPGHAALTRATYLLGTGSAGGTAWSMQEYVGPWGVCFVSARSSGSVCAGAGGITDHRQYLVHEKFASVMNAGYFMYLDEVGAPVDRVSLTLSSGQVIRPAVTRGADGQKFLVYSLARGQKVQHFTAYGTDGQQLGTGTVAGLGS